MLRKNLKVRGVFSLFNLKTLRKYLMGKDLKGWSLVDYRRKEELLKERQGNEVSYLRKRTTELSIVHEEGQRPGRKVRALEKEL